MNPLRLDDRQARLVMRLIGASGTAVGAGSIAFPRFGLRLVGIDADGRGAGWMARLFGCRDLALCGGLAAQSWREKPDPMWLDVLAASQVGDLVLTAWLHRRGELSRRGLATVLLTAPPTLVACVAARLALGQPSTVTVAGAGSTGVRPTL